MRIFQKTNWLKEKINELEKLTESDKMIGSDKVASLELIFFSSELLFACYCFATRDHIYPCCNKVGTCHKVARNFIFHIVFSRNYSKS